MEKYISYFTAVINAVLPINPSFTSATASGLPSVGSSVSCFYLLTGIDIQGINQLISFWFQLSSITATSVTLDLFTLYNSITLYSASFLLLRYNGSISASPLQIQVTSQQFLRYNSANSDTSLSYNVISTLFGTWGVATQSDNYFNFNYSVTNGAFIYTTTNHLTVNNGAAAIVI